MKISNWLAIFALLTFAGSSVAQGIESIAPKQELAIAKGLFNQLQSKNFSALVSEFDPAVKSPNLNSTLEKMAELAGSEKPLSSQVVGVHVHQDKSTQDTVWNTSILIEYSFPNRYLLLTAVLQSRNGVIQIEGFHLNPMDESVEMQSRFKWAGQDFTHYVVLAVCIVVPLLILVALILCIRTPIPKRKWVWIVFIIFGIFRFHFNWNDGSFEFLLHQGANSKTFEFISFQLFGTGFVQSSAFSPWILTSSLPLGALVFLYKRKQWSNEISSTVGGHPGIGV